MAEYKYLEYIPFPWTGCNNKGIFLETELVLDMMVISMLEYQAVDFKEAIPGHHSSGKQLIRGLFSKTTLRNNPLSSQGDSSTNRGVITPVNSDDGLPDDSTNNERNTRIRFKPHSPISLIQPTISASHNFQDTMPMLPSHPQHREPTGIGYAIFSPSTHHVPILGTGYHANEIGTRRRTIFPALTKYLATELGRHLAVMCRMYNDYDSLARDKAEKNLNSVNFPEVEKCAGSSMTFHATEKQTTTELQEEKRIDGNRRI
ncbi:uncharacterized protein EAF01_003354 [Botrytis porri]|uniref:Uncharacterized protein n=1 Tax=Botrytis porri TaxID=87229 RepID=A0A4Z1KWC4_9HELO|nr:uncharacterized protein EAF01_003354 [Botrytis porri]KAF7909636.1 hypothetical protein EAF01_003354 [Botrytis porri]TGO88716.1 hypothetical protein BPOR_0145g00010 [Botrytis porri]